MVRKTMPTDQPVISFNIVVINRFGVDNLFNIGITKTNEWNEKNV